MNFDAIVADEIHHCKNSAAIQTKKLLQLGKGVSYRKGMTGTIITNDLLDVWSIAEFIDPKIFKTNYWGFRNRYMYDANAGKPWLKFPDWQPKPGAIEEVQRKLTTISIRFTKREVLPWLPPMLFEKRTVEMTGEQARAYKELKRDFITELEQGGVLAAPQILSRVTKLIEIANGFAYRDGIRGAVPSASLKEGKHPNAVTSAAINTAVRFSYRFKPNPKIEELKNLLDEIGNKRVAIWAGFQDSFTVIQQALKSESRIIAGNQVSGSVKPEERHRTIEEFNADKFQYLLCSTETVAEGETILAPYVIFFSRNWKLLERLQPLGRHHRPGAEQFENVTVFDLVTQDSADEEVFAALEKKENLLESLNPTTWREWLNS